MLYDILLVLLAIYSVAFLLDNHATKVAREHPDDHIAQVVAQVIDLLA